MQMFFYLDSYIENIKNIQEIANHKIDDYCEYLEEIEDLEEYKSNFIDFALAIRKQMNLLSNSIGELNKLNDKYTATNNSDKNLERLYF